MWPLKVILVCACWAGISSQPPTRDMQSLVQSTNNIYNMLQDTKSILEGLREEFSDYKTDKDLNKETIRNLIALAEVKEQNIQNLTAQLEAKAAAMQQQEGQLRRMEDENRGLVTEAQQKDETLADLEEQLGNLKRATQWDCEQLLLQGHTENGVYTIYPRNSEESAEVWCDMTTEGGGWTVFLNRARQPAQLNFSQPWRAYADGFGDPNLEYWLGNKHLHAITKSGPYVLRIDAQNLEGEKRFGKWLQFSIGDENSKFKIKVAEYSTDSTLGDVLTEVDQNGEKYNPNGMKFSTMDQDNDRREGKSCSKIFGSGGWWYNNCYRLNPTAPLGDRNGDNTKARLYYWGPDIYTVQGVQALQLKIRKR